MSSSVKSGHNLSRNRNSEYTICQGKKLLVRNSPLVLITRSGSGSPFVYKLSEIVSSEILAISNSPFFTCSAILLTAVTISFLPP